MDQLAHVLLAVSAGFLSSCGTQEDPSISRPIATARVAEPMNYAVVKAAVDRFARKYRFAVQEVISEPRGMVEFNIQLFRDDVRLTISRLGGGQTELLAYPLCACEANRQFGLQSAANAAVANLKLELLAQQQTTDPTTGV